MTARYRLIRPLVIPVATILVLYGVGCGMIYRGVRHAVRSAQFTYGGDPVSALIAQLEDETASYEDRNNAIWALGQIGDKRALPVLYRLRTGEKQKITYDSTAYIVQYSVKKAIKQINGFTLTKWMYRRLE